MTAIFVPIGAQAAADAAAAEAAATAASADLAAAPVVAVVAAGAAVDYTLLHWKPWTNLWEHVGANVSDWFHDGFDALFGGGGVSLQTVSDMIQLSLHGANRLSRELFTEASVAAHAGIHTLAHYIDGARRDILSLEHGVLHLSDVIAADVLHVEGWAENYVDQHLRKLLDDITGIEHGIITLLEAWAFDNILHPLLKDFRTVNARVDHLLGNLGHIIDTRVGDLLDARLLHIVAEITALSAVVSALATEIEECAEPMCDYAGPKSDWGKLLSKFAPAAILGLLAEIAATNPQALESGAEDLANMLGPVLSQWVESWALGTPGHFPAQPTDVGHAIGHVPLIP